MELILFLGHLKNDGCDGAIKNCTFGEHPAVLAKRNLLANKSSYWPRRHLASESEQIPVFIPSLVQNINPNKGCATELFSEMLIYQMCCWI